MRKVVVTVTFEVPYHGYDTAAKNKRAEKEIVRWIKEGIDNELSFLPMFVEKDENGEYIEDVTQQVKFKVK